MPKADVLAFVQSIANSQADASTIERYYRDVVFDLCQRGFVTNVTGVQVTSGQSEINIPADVIEMLGVIFDDRILDRITNKDQLAWISRTWRDDKGMPVAWVADDEAVKEVRLYPTPDLPTKDVIPVHGAPLGQDYAGYSAVLLHTERRDDLPVWLETVAAFQILSMEFSRESDHRDPLMAMICQQMANFLFQLVVTGEE